MSDTTNETEDKFVPVPELPKGLRVETFNDKHHVEFPATTRRRMAIMTIYAFFAIPTALALIFGSWEFGRYADGNEIFGAIMLSVFYALVTFGIAYFIYRARVRIGVVDGAVTVNGKHYDPAHFEGLRYDSDLEYSVQGKSPVVFGGIGIKYGRWGIRTPFMVDKGYVGQYIVFTNEFIGKHLSEPLPKYAPSAGVRQQAF